MREQIRFVADLKGEQTISGGCHDRLCLCYRFCFCSTPKVKRPDQLPACFPEERPQVEQDCIVHQGAIGTGYRSTLDPIVRIVRRITANTNNPLLT